MRVSYISPVVFIGKDQNGMIEVNFCMTSRDTESLATFWFRPSQLLRIRNAIVTILSTCEPVETIDP